MAGKYSPLERYLAGLPDSTCDVTMTFEHIERILGDQLPPSAHKHRPWWANERDGQHVHAHSWLDAGWKVDSVDQNRKQVRFRRK